LGIVARKTVRLVEADRALHLFHRVEHHACPASRTSPRDRFVEKKLTHPTPSRHRPKVHLSQPPDTIRRCRQSRLASRARPRMHHPRRHMMKASPPAARPFPSPRRTEARTR
jgi:hypothetical protein